MTQFQGKFPELPSVGISFVYQNNVYKGYNITIQATDETEKVIEFIPGKEVEIPFSESTKSKSKELELFQKLIDLGLQFDNPKPVIFRDIPDGIYKEYLSSTGRYMIVEYKNRCREGKAIAYGNVQGPLASKDLPSTNWSIYKNGILEENMYSFNRKIIKYKDGWLTEIDSPFWFAKFERGKLLEYKEIIDGEVASYFQFQNGNFVGDFRFTYIVGAGDRKDVRGTFGDDKHLKMLPQNLLDVNQFIFDISTKIIWHPQEVTQWLNGILDITFVGNLETKNKEFCEQYGSKGIYSKVGDKWLLRRYYENGEEICFTWYLQLLNRLLKENITKQRRVPEITKEILEFL